MTKIICLSFAFVQFFLKIVNVQNYALSWLNVCRGVYVYSPLSHTISNVKTAMQIS